MNHLAYEDNKLIINGTEITMKYPIKKIAKIENKYIILMKIPHVNLGFEELNNILCYNENGEIQWRISSVLPTSIVSDEQIPYVAIQTLDENLYATDFWGRRFRVDLSSGRLIDVDCVR